ncbi:MAG: WD40 repeat domain-containing protein, partial [Acidobacteria bacterium]|nr:WD40 repeat domain-containing protein [Acidobacteriota bacterium]
MLIWAVAWHPAGAQLAFAGWGKSVYIWEPAAGDQAVTLRGHLGGVPSVSWSPDGNYLASAGAFSSEDRTVKIWEPATGSLVQTFQGDPTSLGGFISVAWHPEGRLLATSDTAIKLWDVEAGKVWPTFGYPAAGLAWSRNGRYLVGGTGLLVYVWEPETMRLIWSLTGERAAWSPDGRYLAATSYYTQGVLRVYDMETGQLVQTMEHSWINAVAWSPDGRYLATAGATAGPDIRIWVAETAQLIQTLPMPYGRIA